MAQRKPFFELSRSAKWKRKKKLIQDPTEPLNFDSRPCNSDDIPSSLEGPPQSLPFGGLESGDSISDLHCHASIAENVSSEEFLSSETFFDETEDSDGEKIERDYSYDIRAWALQFNISHVAISALLCILRTHKCFEEFPKDARTLLNTPVAVDSRSMFPGHYVHIGILDGLKKVWNLVVEKNVSCIELLINTDGLPLFKSSCNELWPILGSVINIESIAAQVFPIGVYCGPRKPESCFDFFKECVDELVNMINNGIILNGKHISVILKGLCCDAPAKAFLLGVKGHTGYFSCTRCKQEGQYVDNRVTFPQTDCPIRTHEEFLNKTDLEFNVSDTPLVQIPNFNLVSSIALDYMHLICLGVVRTFMSIWVFGKPPHKFSFNTLESISSNLLSLQNCIPFEFARKPRSLNELKRWKATEFRQFLLYTGPVVLSKVFLPHHKEIYNLFMTLHIPITILLSPTLHQKHHSDAKLLLNHFIRTFKDIYGQKYLTHNFHGLTHLSDDVLTFGPLDVCSAFKFENYLATLKKKIRKGDRPLQQIVKRLGEISNQPRKSSSNHVASFPVLSSKFCSGVPVPMKTTVTTEFRHAEFQTFKLSVSHPNNCCLLHDNTIVIIFSIFSSNSNETFIMYKKFLSVQDFYSSPCSSSNLGTYIVSHLSDEFENITIKAVKQKLVILTTHQESIVMPLLHVS